MVGREFREVVLAHGSCSSWREGFPLHDIEQSPGRPGLYAKILMLGQIALLVVLPSPWGGLVAVAWIATFARAVPALTSSGRTECYRPK